LNISGLEPVATFEEDPGELKKDSDGPYLYRNAMEMPRAYLVDHAALVMHTGAYDWRDWRAMVYSETWNPRTTAMIRSDPGTVSRLPPDFLERFDVIVAFGEPGPGKVLKKRVAAAKKPLLECRAADTRWAVTKQCGEALKHAQTEHHPLPDPKREWNQAHLSLPDDAGGRWLILAETYSIYPGWKAEVDGYPVSLFTANGAATAISLPEGAQEVLLSYVPPGFKMGMAVSLTGLAVCVILLRHWIRRRRSERRRG
jgi:hypothetical protein